MAVDGICGFGGTDWREKKMKHHMARRVVAAALLPLVGVSCALFTSLAIVLALLVTLTTAPVVMPFAAIDFFRGLIGWVLDAKPQYKCFSWEQEMLFALQKPFIFLFQWEKLRQLMRSEAALLSGLWGWLLAESVGRSDKA